MVPLSPSLRNDAVRTSDTIVALSIKTYENVVNVEILIGRDFGTTRALTVYRYAFSCSPNVVRRTADHRECA